MRHRKNKKTLDRGRSARRSLFRSLAEGLVTHGKICTTLAKAKSVRPFVEKLITVGKSNTVANRRTLLRYLQSERAVRKILSDISPKYAQRNGGYTRIAKLPRRQGDAAPMAVLELV